MIDMLRKYEIGEGNGCEEIVKCLLSFILLLSFTGTLVQAEETTSMSVEKAIQVFKQQGKTKGTVEGYIVGYTQSPSKYTKDPAKFDDTNVALLIRQMKRIQTKSCLFSYQKAM